jgi:hypothetical protein
MAAQSIFGNPAPGKLMIEKNSSAANVYSRLGIIKNLPGFMDEVSDSEGARISDLLYSVATGAEKGRADVAGNMRESRTWNLVFQTTSNKSAYQKLDEYTDSAQGQKSRLLEFTIKHNKVMDDNGKMLNDVLFNNYGHAGITFINQIITMRKDGYDFKGKIDGAIESLQKDFKYSDSELPPEERFIVNLIACVYCAFDIVAGLGFAPGFNKKAIIKEMVSTVIKNRNKITDAIPNANSILSQYISDHSKELVKFVTRGNESYSTYSCPSSVIGSISVFIPDQANRPTSMRVVIRRDNFERWCKKNQRGYWLLLEQFEKMRDYKLAYMNITEEIMKKERLTITHEAITPVYTECISLVLDTETSAQFEFSAKTADGDILIGKKVMIPPVSADGINSQVDKDFEVKV